MLGIPFGPGQGFKSKEPRQSKLSLLENWIRVMFKISEQLFMLLVFSIKFKQSDEYTELKKSLKRLETSWPPVPTLLSSDIIVGIPSFAFRFLM